jgi:hypothetical protein
MKAQGKAPHSVFTVDLIDAPDQPTRRAVDEVIAFFRQSPAGSAFRRAMNATRLNAVRCR